MGDIKLMKNLLESILDYTENPDGSVTSYAKIGSYDYNDLDPYLNPSTYKGPWAPRYIRSAIEFLKSRYPDIDNYLIPTDKEIAHVYNAKQKVFDKDGSWGVNRKPGIAVNSITDIDKAVHYFLTALALDFPGYIRKAYEGSGNFPTNLYLSLGILLWDSPVIQAIKDRLPQILQDETAKGEKKAERAAKRQEKQAEIAQSFGKFSTDNQLYDISFSSFSEDKFDDIIKSGNDVHIKSVNTQDKPSQDRRAMRPGQFVSAEIVFNEGKKNEYETTITAYSISGNEEGPIVYSSDEFRNLPNRQFNNWVKRKLNQLNSVTTDVNGTETESLKEDYDENGNLVKWGVFAVNDIDGNYDEPIEVFFTRDEAISWIDEVNELIDAGITIDLGRPYEVHKIDENDRIIDESLKESIGDDLYLYHATDRKNLDSISKQGLLINPPQHNWKGMTDNYYEKAIFLAFSPEVAEDYVSCQDNPPDEIAILKVKLDDLNDSAIDYDWNNRCEYHNDINSIVYKQDIPAASLIPTSTSEEGFEFDDYEGTELYDRIFDIFWEECATNLERNESLKGSTKINIRESLNGFDIKTNNRYDLRNSYDSAIMTNDDKIKLAKMISLGESYSNIAKYIEKFI